MKTIIDSGSTDLIIKYSTYPTKRDEKGRIIYEDQGKLLTLVKNRIDGIIIYNHTTINEYGQTQISIVNLSESDIEKLYNKIQELKNDEYLDIASDDDLPF